MRVEKGLKRFHDYNKIANTWEIARRVFAQNSFDGILTIMGLILGSYYAKVTDSRIVIITGVSACIAMGVSGVWGTYFTEQAERRKKMLELESATLRKLHNTRIERAERLATTIISVIDGLSPFLSALIVLIPFFFVNGLTIKYAYIGAMAIAFMMLASLGAFLGKISKENILKGGLKMVIAGIVCIILSFFLQHL